MNQFEQHIDESILKRGLSYFKKGNVVEVEEIDAGRYKAIVEGTEEYTVGLTVTQGMVEDAVCSCPYDLGPFCKHMAAVLFYLQKEELDIQPIEKSPGPGHKKSTTALKKRATIMDKVRDVLEKVPHEELKQFITIQCENSSNFRNLVLATFVTQQSAESKSFYSKQIKSILRSVAGRDKIIFRNKGYQVAQKFLEKHLENSTFRAKAINNALDQLNYAQAGKLAMDGMKQDEKTYPGLVIEWYNWLLKIAQAEGNRENIIKYARVL